MHHFHRWCNIEWDNIIINDDNKVQFKEGEGEYYIDSTTTIDQISFHHSPSINGKSFMK
jgi:hypothetical protein